MFSLIARFTTAVFNPLKLKSNESFISGRGNGSRLPLADSASFWISGPPGNPNLSTLAVLSKASPAASSRVFPIIS